MRDIFTTIIISIIIILLIIVFGFFGLILWNEYQELQNVVEPEAVQTVFSESENTLQEDIKVPQIVENPLDKLEDSSNTSNTSNVNYENVQIDKYFYNQLDEYSGIIYKAFESNKENMKTGTYRIELGDAFSSLLIKSNGQELLKQYYQSAIEAYTYDNPEIFYLNPNKMYLNIETTTRGSTKTYNAYINNGSQTNYLTDEFSSKEQISQAISSLQNIRSSILQNRTGNTYDDIKMVHDYIINNTEYDTTLSKPNIYNIYGTLISKQAVCEGYARTFKYLMDGLGVPCTLVIGKATNSEGKTENHAWNYVKIGDKWYAIDSTWDDPVSSTGWVSQSSKYKYFLKGSGEFSKDHIPSTQFSEGGKVFSYPDLSRESYK